jgi:cell division ATPase FtsA
MFNKDIGIDLGTTNVLIYIKGQGIVLNEPSVVAIDTDTKRPLAVGTEAKEMLGRTPSKVSAIKPMKDGVIADFETTEIMLNYFIKKVNGKSFFQRPRILICCPSNITQVEKNAIKEAAERTGAKRVFLEVEPKVAAIGAGMDISKPSGNMIIDIGGGTTDIAIVDDGGVEGTKMFSIGGRSFTHQIANRLGLDFEDAEKLKLLADSPEMKPAVRKKLEEAIDRNLDVWESGVQIAIEEFDHVESLPNQVLLCGGGASLSQIPETLATSDWYQELPFSRRPVIKLIEPDDIPGIVNATDRELDHTFVTAMGLLRVGIDTLVGTGNNNSVRNLVARILKN